jgi:hypothetical protein
MARTPIYHVDPCWLSPTMHNTVWTDFNDASLLQVGTLLFDRKGPYAGEVVGLNNSNKHTLYIVHWYKSEGNTILEHFTPAQIEARAAAGTYYWADPCMQEDV